MTAQILTFGLLTTAFPISDLITSGVLAEDAGFHNLWIPDHLVDLIQPGDRADPWTVLGAIGVKTKKIKLGTMTDPFRIHPAKIASILATLDELTAGRAVLGIGAGERMNLEPFGLHFGSPDERAERLAEAIQVIRKLLSSDRKNRSSFEGKYYRLKDAQIDQRPFGIKAPPIYVDAFGAKRTLEVTGRYGDGWFPIINTPESFEKRMALIERAREKSSDVQACPLDAIHTMHTALTQSREDMKKSIEAMKTILITHTSKEFLKKQGFSFETPAADYSYQKVTDIEGVPKNILEIASQMPDDIAEQFIFTGTSSEAIEYISRFKKVGATQICVLDVL